jgi:hypothetical protein
MSFIIPLLEKRVKVVDDPKEEYVVKAIFQDGSIFRVSKPDGTKQKLVKPGSLVFLNQD